MFKIPLLAPRCRVNNTLGVADYPIHFVMDCALDDPGSNLVHKINYEMNQKLTVKFKATFF